ncbi:MAG: MMPL family transporter, partial [Mycobacterium sp.]
YNLLLISRIREESAHGVRSGVIRTVGSTGAVITSAGLIFAASMFGLTFASITTLVQIGFIIGAGILLDTFLVRTITVPAVAALVGRANWWPSRPTLPNEQAEAVPMLQRLTKANWLPPRLRPRTSRIKQAEQPPAPPSPTKPNRRRPLRSHKPPIELSSTSQDEKTPRSHHLTSDTSSRGTPIRVAVPPTITEHHRQRRHQSDEHLPRHALPLFGTNAVPERIATNGLEPVVDDQIAANGEHPAEANGEHPAGTDYEQPGQINGQSPVETNGQQTVATNGQHPAEEPVETNGRQPAGTNDKQPRGTNGQHRADTNSHEPVTTAPVDASSEDEGVNEPRWIGRWPANDATFPVGAHNGHQATTTPAMASPAEADRLR